MRGQVAAACERRSPLHVPVFVLLVLAAACAPAAGASHGIHINVGRLAKSKVAEFVKQLPLHGDFMDSLSEGQRGAWTTDLRLTAGQTLAALQEARVTVTVDVKLVGFDGDGNEALQLDARDLAAHLVSLAAEATTVALHPTPRHLSVSPSIEFRVHPAYHKLAPRIASALQGAAAAAHAGTDFTDHPLALLDPTLVANILDEDFATTMEGGGSLTLYILNPRVNAAYAYAYDPEHRSCPGGVHLSQRHRYAFYDLSANVTFYGPGPGGRGQVLEHSVPALKHYRPETLRRAIVPDLAALAWSAGRHLAWPPLHSDRLGYSSKMEVHVVYMHQDLLGAVAHLDKAQMQAELSAAVSGAQEVEVHEHALAFGDCPSCVVGYASALRARTAKPHEAKEGATLHMTQHLDAQALEQWAREWRDVILSDLGVAASSAGPRAGVAVLPVFIFDVAGAETVLIEGWRQAIALPGGGVVAVRSGQSTVPAFFGCHAKQAHVDPQELHRPVMAAVLQAGWGVADTALSWSDATGPAWSYLWSLGPTPFGPLSSVTSLSAILKGIPLRNLALSQLDGGLGHAVALVRGFARVRGEEGEVKALLTKDQAVQYHRRIALLLHKAREATSALSRLDHKAALGYALSLAHDAAALHAIARAAKDSLDVELTCAGAAARRRWWLLPGGAVAFCVLCALWRVARALRGGGGRDRKKFDHIY